MLITFWSYFIAIVVNNFAPLNLAANFPLQSESKRIIVPKPQHANLKSADVREIFDVLSGNEGADFFVGNNPSTHSQGEALSALKGSKLANANEENQNDLIFALDGRPGWIGSLDSNFYTGTCTFSQNHRIATFDCNSMLYPVCNSVVSPQPVLPCQPDSSAHKSGNFEGVDPCALQRITSGASSSQGSFASYDVVECSMPVTPALSGAGYDLLDDLSVNTLFINSKTELLIFMLKQQHPEPIQLINFDGLLKYFEEIPGITNFSDEHHLELCKRIAADAANLVEVWTRLKFFVETKDPDYGDRNVFRVYALLKNYLIRTDHQLSKLFKNEVYDDQLSNASRAEGKRGETSTICSMDEDDFDDEDYESEEELGKVMVFTPEFDLQAQPMNWKTYSPSIEGSSSEEVIELGAKILSAPLPPPPKCTSPEQINEIEQLEEIQKSLKKEQRRIVPRHLISSSLGYGPLYESPMLHTFARFAPSQPTIEEAKTTDLDGNENCIEEID